MAAAAVRSLLPACEVVWVFDGPVGGSPNHGLATDWRWTKREPRVNVKTGEWKTDASKRTAMLEVTRRYTPPVWGAIVDGDEILLWGEYLPDMLEHAERVAEWEGHEPMGVTLRIMEAGGSMQFIPARVLRLDLIDSWLISSYHLLLRNGVEISKPNIPALAEGEPDSDRLHSATGMQLRRPLHGETHLLHRSFLRPPQRVIPRLHDAEAKDFESLLTPELRAVLPDAAPSEEGSRIWLPT